MVAWLPLVSSSLTSAMVQQNTTSLSNVTASLDCPPGYTGSSCKQCCNRFLRDDSTCSLQAYQKSDLCKSCPSIGIASLTGILALTVLATIFIAYGQMHSATPAMYYIGVDYLQTLSYFGSTPIRWPRALKAIFTFISIFNFDLDAVLPLECFFGATHAVKMVALLLAPLCICLCLLALSWATKCSCGTRRSSNSILGVGLGIMYFAYLQLVSLSMEALTSNDSALIWTGSFAICFYMVAIPLLVAERLLKKDAKIIIKHDQARREESGYQSKSANTPSDRSCEEYRQRYGFLYGAYQSKYWFWPLVMLGRKLMLGLTVSLWQGRPVTLASVLAVISSVSGAANYFCRPFMTLVQEMTYLRKGLPDVANDQYRSLTMRWNVDAVLHACLVSISILGVLSSLTDETNRMGNIAISFIGFSIVLTSLKVLVWAVFSEASRMIRFAPPDQQGTRGSSLIGTRITSTLRSSGLGASNGSASTKGDRGTAGRGRVRWSYTNDEKLPPRMAPPPHPPPPPPGTPSAILNVLALASDDFRDDSSLSSDEEKDKPGQPALTLGMIADSAHDLNEYGMFEDIPLVDE